MSKLSRCYVTRAACRLFCWVLVAVGVLTRSACSFQAIKPLSTSPLRYRCLTLASKNNNRKNHNVNHHRLPVELHAKKERRSEAASISADKDIINGSTKSKTSPRATVKTKVSDTKKKKASTSKPETTSTKAAGTSSTASLQKKSSKKAAEARAASSSAASSSSSSSSRSSVLNRLVNGSDKSSRMSQVPSGSTSSTTTEEENDEPISRRVLLGSVLLVAGATVANTAGDSNLLKSLLSRVAPNSQSGSLDPFVTSSLRWEVTPVNKRTGVTVFDAEQAGYNVRFVTYLSRFLLTFDGDCQKWWYARAADIPRMATQEEVEAKRLNQFAAFSASVEVGLIEYLGEDGPKRLLDSLVQRYCPEFERLQQERISEGLPPLKDAAAIERQKREINEARRQIAILFALMEKGQPMESITKLLAAIDNGSIASVRIQEAGSGYAPGYGPPVVMFPPPAAGDEYERATGRAFLRPNGKILRVDVVDRGFGYAKAPIITFSPPAALENGSNPAASPAKARAVVFRSGVNKGRLERIILTDPGSGYSDDEAIRIKVSAPEMKLSDGGVTATAAAIRELKVSKIEITNPGSGYAVEKPIPVYVEPPPPTARINLNDPMMARLLVSNTGEPIAPPPTPKSKKGPYDVTMDPNSVSARIVVDAATNGGIGGEGGCVGRACYDTAVVAEAIPRAEKDSYTNFRDAEDGKSSLVKGTSSGGDGRLALPFWGGGSTSQALSLLPAGIGLEYDVQLKRYVLAVGDELLNQNPPWLSLGGNSGRQPLDPEFGPRGRSPIERDMTLVPSTWIRFVLSGATCCSGAHLLLTPIDVVKTKVQTNPEQYKGIVSGFFQVVEEEGGDLRALFRGWIPTFVGFFTWGGVTYSTTELARRSFTEWLGPVSVGNEVPIILASAACASFLGAFAITPFESVRIRSVAQPDYAPTVLGVVERMVKEEGILSLFSIVPAFLTKEIPFAMAKFTTFTVFTSYLYTTFPAAREDLQLSLLVSLLGGTMGGFFASIVSNPADVTISQMKKAKTKMGPVEAARLIIDRDGPFGLLRGLPLRMVFYPVLVSMQFLVYDSIRYALGIGADDLKLYLDVLGGALRQSGGPV